MGEPLPGHEQYKGRLVIPYLANGHTVSLKFRASASTTDRLKYMCPPAQHPRLYNVDVLREGHTTVAIVEGELDALVMTHTVGIPAVSVPGSGMWFPHMPRCFADVERVLVVCDNDKSQELKQTDDEARDGKKKEPNNPGQALARKIASDIRGSKIITPPPDQDISEWVLADGADSVRARMGKV